MEILINRGVVELPNQDGVYDTELGQIGVSIINKKPNGVVQRIVLEGEVMRGTPLKNRHKRSPRKMISLNIEGSGAQTLSKRETVYIDLYPRSMEDHLRDLRTLLGLSRGDQGY